MSMAAGEYVSVSSQADTEAADIAKETAELKADPAGELTELAQLYQGRGLSAGLAMQVAQEMMAGDALAAHTRDELGISPALAANPIQAGLVSAACGCSSRSRRPHTCCSLLGNTSRTCRPRGNWCTDWRRGHVARRGARHAVGCACHAGNSNSGMGVRDGGLRCHALS
jgi:hypothetical protein